MRRRLLLLLAIVIFCGTSLTAARASEEEEQQQELVKKFVTAYFNTDWAKVRQCIPKDDARLFMAYPFISDVTFARPRVDKRQALLEFTAKVGDSKFPGKGGIVFYRQDGTWKVRLVLFYDKIPMLFGLPSRSVTRDDRAQEPTVQRVGEEFIKHWKANDSKNMLAHWYNWPERDDRPKPLSFSNFTFTPSVTSWHDKYISYTTRATYRYGILSYSMNIKGGLVLVKEGNAWKVRANHFIFDF